MKEVICLGDINIDHLKWTRNNLLSVTEKLQPLIELLFETNIPLGVSQCVTSATQGEEKPTIIRAIPKLRRGQKTNLI